MFSNMRSGLAMVLKTIGHLTLKTSAMLNINTQYLSEGKTV